MSTSISDLAYAELASAIATCKLAPGSPINERTDAARLGMSRTPFRQALHRLALEGLVVSVPKRGTYVTPLDPVDIEHNMRVREAIEIAMAHQMLAEGRNVDDGVIRDLLRVQRDAMEADDWIGFLKADEDFHQHILEAAGNRRAVEAVQRCWLYVNRVRYIKPLSRAAMKLAVAQHKEIHAALREGDAERARWAIRRHLGEPLLRNLEDLAEQIPSAFEMPFAADDQHAHRRRGEGVAT